MQKRMLAWKQKFNIVKVLHVERCFTIISQLWGYAILQYFY